LDTGDENLLLSVLLLNFLEKLWFELLF